MTTDRLNHLTTLIQTANLDALVLNPGPTLAYLTGLQFHLMERPTVAFFLAQGEPAIILGELEVGGIAAVPYPVQVFAFGDDPATWEGVFQNASQMLDLTGRKIGVEPTGLRFLEMKLLERALPGAQFVSAADAIRELRIRKDAPELDLMRQAVFAAQQAFNATLPLIKVGMTERQLARELTLQLLRAGSDPELPFPPIVAGGSNSANPHATPSDRPLESGDLVIIDWGAAVNGYFSDLTRTIAIRETKPEAIYIHGLVAEANAAGRAAGKPGVPAGTIDAAARKVIEEGGYGKYFTHRTGHGLGMQAHEEPYMFAGNPLLLDTGMVYTVEPGIYLPGSGGVRIEDNVVVTRSGAESLSNLVRDLIVVG